MRKEESFKCEICEDFHEELNELGAAGQEVCDDCYENVAVDCDYCGIDGVENEDIIYVDRTSDMVCVENCIPEHFVESDCCLELVPRVDVVFTHEGDVFCDAECAVNNDHFFCEDCGELHHVDYRSPRTWDLVCEGCCSYNGYIREYRDNPEVDFYGSPSNGRFYGVELEIDDGNPAVFSEALNEEIEPRIYLMEDGSLSSDGVEVISQPMSLDEHVNGGLWEIVSEEAENYGFSSHDTRTCGLHVHVSKDAFDWDILDDIIDNALYIVNRYWTKMVRFSRRNHRELNEWAEKLTDKNGSDVKLRDIKTAYKGNRYMAVNVTNASTIEFRMFKGSLRVKTIKSSIQMVDVIMSLAERYAENGYDIEKMAWSAVVQEAQEHQELHEELERLELN